ncbi:MAG: hypothetical protein V2A79_18215 [Planctomycetota bacterium]
MKQQSALGKAHAVLTVCVALGGLVVFEAQGAVVVSSPLLPPVGPDSDCGSPVGYLGGFHARYDDYGVDLSNPIHAGFTNIGRTPGPGYEQETFNSSLTADSNWGPITLTGSVVTRVYGYTSGQTGTFQAEIISMYLIGYLGPYFIEIRESPTLFSVGTTTIEDLGGGRYRITSFFDVFTELQIEGGGWDEQDSPAGYMELDPTGSCGACCDPLTGNCTRTAATGCAGNYLGDGTDCTPNPCPPPPTGACCDPATGACTVTTQLGCAGEYQGDGTDCDPNPCIGACCDPLTGACTETTETGCTGNYQGDGTDCDPNPCPPPTGACCRPDGSCLEDITSNACEQQWGGTWKGPGTACPEFAAFVDCLAGPVEPLPPFDCERWDLDSDGHVDLYDYGFYQRDFVHLHCVPDPVGACCRPDGSCQEINEWDCTHLYGPTAYRGDGTDCDPNPCPPIGACCDPWGGQCIETTQLYCTNGYGWDYQGDGTTCVPNPCIGACCDPWGGQCIETTQFYCTNGYGWDYQGGGTDCDPNPCVGACCDPWGGQCIETTQAYCTNGYGWDYQGDGIPCTPNPCPPTGACCPETGVCTVTTQLGCTGEYQGDGTTCGPPNPCMGACCEPWGGQCIETTQLYCTNGLGWDYQGDGTTCGPPNPCMGACCDPLTGACTETTGTGCVGNYLGDGTDCDPNPCPPPTGACCDPMTGACTVTTQVGCAGQYQGDGTTCGPPNPCMGACCYPDPPGGCMETTPAGCFGIYMGGGTDCYPDPCGSPPTGACCDPATGNCTVTTQSGCAGVYQGDGTDCDPNPCPSPCPSYCGCQGVDCWYTSTSCSANDTKVSFAATPIPAGFFCSGQTSPFSATVPMKAPGPCADTKMERLEDLCFLGCQVGMSDTTAIRLIKLEMVGCDQISVPGCGLWTVYVYLSSTAAPDGSMTATVEYLPCGGTFDGYFWVQPRYEFYSSAYGWRILDTAEPPGFPPIYMPIQDVPWQLGESQADPCSTPDDNFYVPSVAQQCHENPSGGHEHCVTVPDC